MDRIPIGLSGWLVPFKIGFIMGRVNNGLDQYWADPLRHINGLDWTDPLTVRLVTH